MMKHIALKRLPVVFLLPGVIILVSLFWFTTSQASERNQQTEAYCLSCHSNPDLEMTLPSGEVLPLYIDPEKLPGSVHSPNGIECEACHTEITTYPHPPTEYETRRELSRTYYAACQMPP
jgi:hypothetical protein